MLKSMKKHRFRQTHKHSGTSDKEWYFSGNAPAPFAVYQPIAGNGWNPSTFAESCINRINPGTWDATCRVDRDIAGHAPPAFSNAWAFNGIDTHLETGFGSIVLGRGTGSFIVRVSDIVATPSNADAIHGGYWETGGLGREIDITIYPNYPTGGNNTFYENGDGRLTVYRNVTKGVFAVAGNMAYFNGVIEGIIPAWVSPLDADMIGFGGPHYNIPEDPLPLKYGFKGNILAAAFWNTSIGHAIWIPAVSSEVVLL